MLPPLPIGAEHALWGSPQMAAEGHRFLWAPNEADEAPTVAGSVAAPESVALMTPGGGGGGSLPRDLSVIDSVDGGVSVPDSGVADGDDGAGDAALADGVNGSFGSAGSPVRACIGVTRSRKHTKASRNMKHTDVPPRLRTTRIDLHTVTV